MSKLKLNRAAARGEEAGGANPYRFPVEAARRLGGGSGTVETPAAAAGVGPRAGAGSEGVDVISQIEDALDRMQDRLEDLSDQIGSLRFPGVERGEDEGPDGGPSAA